MDVRLSAEQVALRESAAQVAERLGPKTVGAIGDPDRTQKLDAVVVESGWRSLRDETGGGGPLASGVEAAVVAEELGKGLADVSFLGPTLAAELRRLAGATPSDTVETVVLDRELSSITRTPAAPKVVAIDARGSSSALVVIADADRWFLGQVEIPGTPSGLDLTRPSVALDGPFDVARLASSRPLTADDLTRWSALGLALTCADLVGTIRGAVELACTYAADRRQYGSAIGSFQAVQHLLADAFVAMEGSRSVTLHAAWGVDALPAEDALAAAAVAKAYCARAARSVCETAIQVHGGIGNTWECLAHVFLRRALLSSDVLGDASICLARVLDHEGIGGRDGLR